jgi:integrase
LPNGPNPLHGVSVPGRPKKYRGAIYTIKELTEMVDAVEHPQAVVVISVAAFAGLRLSELRGLRWDDFDDERLHVRRSVWRSHVGPTKTEESEASVPVLPILRKILEDYREKIQPSPQDYVFHGPRRKTPLNLHNLTNRVIKPALYAHGLEWRGWHAFRRGLASNLYEIGVKPKVIQAILRHGDISTTLQFYVEVPDEETREALTRLEEWVRIV